MNVTIIDYGIGNLRSLQKALEAVGASVIRTDRANQILEAERLILPGVGAFRACMQEIERRELVEPIRQATQKGIPLLGICVGLQLLFDSSEEGGTYPGLGVLPGQVVRFPSSPAGQPEERLKIPHIGWNHVHIRQPHPVFHALPEAPYFYFVHSYHAQVANDALTLAETFYGISFPSVAGRDHILGVQFHPEKSQKNGLQVLNNFLHWNPHA